MALDDFGFLPLEMDGNFPESAGALKYFKVLPEMSAAGQPEYLGCWNIQRGCWIIRGGVALSHPYFNNNY